MLTNTIIRGDSLAVLPQLPAGCADLVLTDPPYVVGYRDRSGRSIAVDTTTAWIAPAFREIYRTLKDNRFCVSFYGWHRADDFLGAWRRAGFRPAVISFSSNVMLPAPVFCATSTNRRTFSRKVAQRGDRFLYATCSAGITQAIACTRRRSQSPHSNPLSAPSRAEETSYLTRLRVQAPLHAARQMGRLYLGIEVNEGYCRIAPERGRPRKIKL